MTAPPFNPAAFGAVPPPPPQPPQTNPKDQIIALIKERVVFGAEHVTSPGQAQWAYDLLTQQMPDPAQLTAALNNSTTVDIKPLWEKAQQAANSSPSSGPVAQPPEQQLNPAVTTPPPNPISDSAGPQQAAPPADAPPRPGTEPQGPETKSDPAAWDRISGTQCKSLRGLKSRLSKTHKVDWKDYCVRFNLDKETGLELGEAAAPPPPPAGSEIPATPAPASPGIPLQPSATGSRQASLPPAPETPQFGAQPAAPSFARLPTQSYVGSMDQSYNYAEVSKSGIPQLLVWAGGDPIKPEEVAEAYDWLTGAFVGIDGVQQHKVHFHIYQWLMELHQSGQKGELAPLAPAKRSQNLAPQQFQNPAPAPASADVPMFAPPVMPSAAPTPQPSQPAPAAPEQLSLDLVSAASQGQFGTEVQSMTQGMLQQAAVPNQTAPTEPANTAGMGVHNSRQELAAALGGAVDCLFVPLLDVATTDLTGRVDANQLAGQCEAEALRIVTDPQDLKFRKDRQVAEQIFMQKLTENPRLYVLIQGWDWVIPENLVPVILRRVCTGGIVKNGAFLPFNF